MYLCIIGTVNEIKKKRQRKREGGPKEGREYHVRAGTEHDPPKTEQERDHHGINMEPMHGEASEKEPAQPWLQERQKKENKAWTERTSG